MVSAVAKGFVKNQKIASDTTVMIVANPRAWFYDNW